jgi:hypothetical protein
MKNRAIIYVGNDGDHGGNFSIKSQIQECAEYSKDCNFVLIGDKYQEVYGNQILAFVDNRFGPFHEHETFFRNLWIFYSKANFNIVITYCLSRLMRKDNLWSDFSKKYKSLGGKIIVLKKQFEQDRFFVDSFGKRRKFSVPIQVMFNQFDDSIRLYEALPPSNDHLIRLKREVRMSELLTLRFENSYKKIKEHRYPKHYNSKITEEINRLQEIVERQQRNSSYRHRIDGFEAPINITKEYVELNSTYLNWISKKDNDPKFDPMRQDEELIYLEKLLSKYKDDSETKKKPTQFIVESMNLDDLITILMIGIIWLIQQDRLRTAVLIVNCQGSGNRSLALAAGD